MRGVGVRSAADLGKGRGRSRENSRGVSKGVLLVLNIPTFHEKWVCSGVAGRGLKVPRQEVKLDRQKNENEGLGASSVWWAKITRVIFLNDTCETL